MKVTVPLIRTIHLLVFLKKNLNRTTLLYILRGGGGDFSRVHESDRNFNTVQSSSHNDVQIARSRLFTDLLL